MQGRWPVALLAAAFAVAAAALAAAPAQATHLAPRLALDVVHASDLGCSNDSSGADLRVSVFLDGHLALRTAKAQDRDEPWFGSLVAVSDPGRPIQVTIRVEEAEPGGAFLLGTDWLTCDASPGAQQEFVTTWSGGVQEYVARGDASNAASAIVVLGPAPAAVPALQATAGPHSIDLSWPAVGGTPRVTASAFAPGTTLPAGATSHRLAGLCDGQWHQVRLAVVDHPWQVAGAARAVQTTDVAPQAARILSGATAAEGWRVEWESRTTHDVARYEVLVGPDAAAPPAAARGSVEPFSDWARQSATVPTAAGDAYAWVRTVDRGGNAAVSPAFALGSPAQSPTGQSSWTQLDPCAGGLPALPTVDPAAPDVAEDVFAAEAGHPPSSPSTSSSSSSSSPSFAPVPVDTGGRPVVTFSPGPVQHADAEEDAAGPRTGALGWMAVAVAGLALFALVLVLVTRLLRR